MKKTPAKIKRPLWVAGLNIALALTVSTTQAFATAINSVTDLLAVSGDAKYVLMVDLDLSSDDASSAEGEQLADEETAGNPSYISNGFTGTLDGGGRTISGLTKPLFNVIGAAADVDGIDTVEVKDLNLTAAPTVEDDVGAYLSGGIAGKGALANTLQAGGTIEWVSFLGDVIGTDNVGGLVGISSGAITNSFATGTVTGNNNVGGLVGFQYAGDISNSFATGNVSGIDNVGGLVGFQFVGYISNSYATSTVTGSGDNVGGLVGDSAGAITNSAATGTVIGKYNVGGLVGFSSGTISNSYASGDVREGAYDIGGLVGELNDYGSITNSYATGNVEGIGTLGGLVGVLSGDITNSYATGNVDGTNEVGLLVGYSVGDITDSYGYGEATINGAPIGEDPHLGEGDAPEILSIVNFGFADPNLPFAVSASINDGLPYLISLIESYDVAVTPSFNLRSYYTQAAKSLNKALTSLGFKSNFSSHPNLGFKALEQNQSNSPAVIQLFEVSEYQNSNILLNKEDGLQLSISSYYKEAVEIWTQGLNGEYLYLGLVEFDKDGKAILPTLKFDTASTYQLLMIKAADKLSEKPNLEAKVGQITINVF